MELRKNVLGPNKRWLRGRFWRRSEGQLRSESFVLHNEDDGYTLKSRTHLSIPFDFSSRWSSASKWKQIFCSTLRAWSRVRNCSFSTFVLMVASNVHKSSVKEFQFFWNWSDMDFALRRWTKKKKQRTTNIPSEHFKATLLKNWIFFTLKCVIFIDE